MYDTTPYQGASGWQVYGGTSASSPIIASVYALGGVHSDYPAAEPWANPGGLNDVTSGANLFNALGYAPCKANGTTRPHDLDKWDGCATKNYAGLGAGFTPTWFAP